jgi:hypothetical protein
VTKIDHEADSISIAKSLGARFARSTSPNKLKLGKSTNVNTLSSFLQKLAAFVSPSQ